MDYSIFQISLDAVWVIDAERRLVFVNEAAAQVFGVAERRIKLGTPMYEWLTWEDPTLFCMPGGTWGEAARTSYREVTYQSKKGKTGRAQVCIQPVAGGQHWVVFARDVTLEESLHRKYRVEIEAKEKAYAELQQAHALLEQKVIERTAQLSELNRTLAAMMDSLGQGFLIVDSSGHCSQIHSKACLELLETDPSHRPLSQVLRLGTEQEAVLKNWLELVFSERLPFDDLASLGPTRYEHSGGRKIQIEFHPIRGEDHKVSALVLVATDRTREWEAEQATQEEKLHARRIVAILRSKSTFLRLWRSLRGLEANLNKLSASGDRNLSAEEQKNWMRTLHTYKGESASFYLSEIGGILHGLEDDFQNWGGKVRSLKTLSATLNRFEAEELPELGIDVNRASEDREILTTESRVQRLREELKNAGLPPQAMVRFDEELMRAPLSSWLAQWESGLETSCRVAGKLVEMESVGLDQVRVDPKRWNSVADTLIHVFRNIADHGMETPEERSETGKPTTGKVRLEAKRDGALVELKITDDGRGIDIERLRDRLGNPSMTDEAVLERLMQGGVSSKGSVSGLSGRGVGVEAVTHIVRELGGTLDLQTRIGAGTVLTVRIPDVTGAETNMTNLKVA